MTSGFSYADIKIIMYFAKNNVERSYGQELKCFQERGWRCHAKDHSKKSLGW